MAFLGEHLCSLDNKGRLKLPVGLKSQLAPENNGRFVLNRGFEKCLTLYPWDEWQRISAKVNKLNTFVKKNRDFARFFFRGATELVLDSTDRLNLPKHLMDLAGIKNEALLTARANIIEIWEPKAYEAVVNEDSDQYSDLAGEVMGDINFDE
ncbi:MAG: division/cell wall cluster transcriptional repressor MraZ [Chitinophagales bacterium]|nr:division/cell wall cluster transcriptional repressor MraZ [Chitinophagales bacterium]